MRSALGRFTQGGGDDIVQGDRKGMGERAGDINATMAGDHICH